MNLLHWHRNFPLFAAGLLLLAAGGAVADSSLPTLGDTTSGIVSIKEERELGDSFLRDLRRSAPATKDVQIKTYTEHLLFHLSTFSELQDRDFRLIVINDDTINAFAAPGSVVGVNLGLFLAAETEAEFSAVLTHELAHLSQRHYARTTESRKKQILPYLTGLLGSILLISRGATDAGLAALHSTQAAATASKLGYSRLLEKEADRIGSNLLYKAKLDPKGMVGIFTRMHQANRHNTRPPEFLLTHPVSEKRIADARNQINRYEPRQYQPSLDYHLMRARAHAIYFEPKAMIERYQKILNNADNPVMRSTGFYGMALGLIKGKNFTEAQKYVDALVAKNAYKLSYQFLQSELWIKSGRSGQAARALENLLQINTGNKAAADLLTKALVQTQQYKKAQAVLKRQTILHPDDVELWYQLAEVAGRTKDIVGVHRARASFYALRGEWEKSIGQLESALLLVPKDSGSYHQISSRLEELVTWQ